MNTTNDKDKIIAFLSSEKAQKKIPLSIKTLTKVYPEMVGIDLAVAPSLQSRPEAILILAILKEGTYILSETIQESLEYLAECEEENQLHVLNSVDLERLYKNETIDEKEYDKLKYSWIKLGDLKAQTYDELQKQFYENYKSRKASKENEKIDEALQKEESLKDKQILKEDDLKTEEKLNFQEEKQWEYRKQVLKKRRPRPEEKLGGWVEKKHQEEEKTSQDRIMFKEESLEEKYLPNLINAAKNHHGEISKEECKLMVEKLKSFNSDSVKADKNILLHEAIDKRIPFYYYKTANVLAMIKYLLGINPLTKASDEVKISFDPIVNNINFQDDQGRTALHIGAKSSAGIIYWLLRLEADPFIQDNSGNTFLKYIPEKWNLVKKDLEKYMEKKKEKEMEIKKHEQDSSLHGESISGDANFPKQKAK